MTSMFQSTLIPRILTRGEAVGNAERMFDKMNVKADGNITVAELEAARR